MVDQAYTFEQIMYAIHGENAYQLASGEHDAAVRRKWLRRSLDRFIRDIDGIDTSEVHKDRLMGSATAAREALKRITDPSWALVYSLVSLCSVLPGYTFGKGRRLHEPSYWQHPEQHYVSEPPPRPVPGHVPTPARIRGDLIRQLQSEGLSTFDIAVVMNIPEHRVKKTLRELTP